VKFNVEVKNVLDSAAPLDELMKHVPTLSNREGIEALLFKLGDHVLVKRLAIIDKTIDATKILVDVKAWWSNDPKHPDRAMDDGAIAKVKPMRTLLKGLTEWTDEVLTAAFAPRFDAIEMFDFMPDVVEFPKQVILACKIQMTQIYEHWRLMLEEVSASLQKGTPGWKGKEEEVLDAPLRETLLVNPFYNELALHANKMDIQMAGLINLHSDGCGIVVDCAKIDMMNRIKGDAIDTVALTYTLFHVTQMIPKIKDAEERKKAGAAIKEALKLKNDTLPKNVQDRLDAISYGTFVWDL
jgi:hypothetical protein